MRRTNLNWLLTFITVISFAFYGNAQNRNITGSNIICNNFYIEGTTMDLSFTLDAVSDDLEYLDYVEITFPAGITPNSGSDISTVSANAITGQVISWGIDQSSGLGPITNGNQYDFTVNVTVDAGLTGLQVANYYLAGDGYGGAPHTINSTFNIEEVPTCPKPTGLNASVPTSSDATLSWIAGNTETNWNIEWDTLGFTQGSGSILTSTDTFVNITGLQAGYTYEFYVQADCGPDSSIWAGPFEFKFLVGDNCSNIQDLATLTAPFSGTTIDYTANDIPNMTCTDADNGSASRIFFIDVNDGEELYIGQTSNTFDSRHSISYGPTCPGDSSILCDDDPDVQETVWTNTTGSTQRVYFIIAGYSSSSQGDFVLDWHIVTCPDPSNLGIDNLTDVSADLTWTAINATTWDIEFDTAGFTPTGVPTFNDITTNPYNVTGLFSETDYEFYVREVCSATDTSNWVGPFSFTTTADCPIPTDLTVTNITSNTVDLGWNGYFATNWDIEWDTLGFAPTGTPTENDITTNPFNITGLNADTDYEFYVRADCGQNNIDTTIWVGPFSFTTEVSCPAPTALNVTDLTSSSATLQWITGGSINWNIVYGVAGFNMADSTPIAVTDTFYAVSGLTDGTYYEFYVQDSCGTGDASLWTGPYSFATDCGVVTPEYVQDFASYIPMCWEEAKGELAEPTTFTSTTSSNWLADGFANNGTTGSARMNVYSTNVYEWLISKSIDLGTLANYRLEFDLALTDYGNQAAPDQNGTDDKFVVVISTDNGATWNLSDALRLWDNAGSSYVYNDISYTGEHVVIDLSAYTGVVKIGFYAESTVSNADNDLFIDNFRVRETPSCPEPMSQNAINIDGHSADLQWISGGSSNWNIVYGPQGFNMADSSVIAITDTIYNVSGLMPTTSYDFYVQDSCAVGDVSIWVGPYTFTTTVSCPDPSTLTATNITTTTATLNWITGSSSNWNIVYGAEGFNITDSTAIAVTDTFYNVSGLSVATSYDFYVQDSCGVGDVSAWVGPFTFTTECEAITSYPYYEDFENAGNMPVCWSQEYDNGTHDWIFIDGDNSALTAYQGSYNAAFKHVSSGDITKLITPTFDLTSLSTPKIVFAHAQRNWAGDQDSLK